MSKALPILSLASVNEVPPANDTCACKPFLQGDLLDQFLYEWGAHGYPTEARSVPQLVCSFLLRGRKQISMQWSCFFKVVPHSHSHLSITLVINKGVLNNHINFWKSDQIRFSLWMLM